MLQTCTRCRSRRVKCDTNLPSCANCTKGDLNCTFFDNVLKEELPRRCVNSLLSCTSPSCPTYCDYIKELYDQINDLKSRLEAQQRHQTVLSPQQQRASVLQDGPSFFVRRPHCGSQYSFLQISPCSLIAQATMQGLEVPPSSDAGSIGIIEDDVDSCVPLTIDKASLTPPIIRTLLTHYSQFIRPSYPIPLEKFQQKDNDLRLHRLSLISRFNILITCAIAAAHKSYWQRDWINTARLCREWAEELAKSLICERGGHTLVTFMLLLVYELVDPSRGMLWEFLGCAVRTSLQLGWHRTEYQDYMTSSEETSTHAGYDISDRLHIMSILQLIHAPLRMTFNRPSMLDNFTTKIKSQDDAIMKNFLQLTSTLFSPKGPATQQTCPNSEQILILIRLLNGLPQDHSHVQQSWLLFLPICILHEPCTLCTSEFHEQKLQICQFRNIVLHAAFDNISSLHTDVIQKRTFVPPLMASTQALTAGCAIIMGIKRGWVQDTANEYLKALLKCAEILTFHQPLWNSGTGFCAMWHALYNAL